MGKAIEFYSCFISYSTKDQEFAERLYADLQAKGCAAGLTNLTDDAFMRNLERGVLISDDNLLQQLRPILMDFVSMAL